MKAKLTQKQRRDKREKFRKFILAMPLAEREAFSLRAGTKYSYVLQIMSGHRTCHPEIAIALARETGWLIHPSDINEILAFPSIATSLAYANEEAEAVAAEDARAKARAKERAEALAKEREKRAKARAEVEHECKPKAKDQAQPTAA